MVITTNRKDVVTSLVEALLQDETPSEVIVVVDGGNDGSYESLQAKGATDARLRTLFDPSLGRRGEAAARQTGVEAATSDVVLFLDDDVMPEPGLIAGHRRLHTEMDDAVVIGYMPVRFRGARQPHELGAYLYSDAYEKRCREYAADPGCILLGLWAGNVSLRRDQALRVGFASDGYAGFSADRDFGLRCLEAGLQGVFDPSLHAWHLYDRDLAAFLSNVRQQGTGRWYIHRRHSEIVGPIGPYDFDQDLPAPAAALVRAARDDRYREVITAILLRLVGVAGFLRLYSVQTSLGRLLRRIEYQRGVIEGSVRTGETSLRDAAKAKS